MNLEQCLIRCAEVCGTSYDMRIVMADFVSFMLECTGHPAGTGLGIVDSDTWIKRARVAIPPKGKHILKKWGWLFLAYCEAHRGNKNS